MISLRRMWLMFSLLLSMALSACGGGDAGTVGQAPLGLAYGNDTYVFEQGEPIVALTPTVGGDAVTSYRVEPALPSGLVLDARSGVISGTPMAVVAPDLYTVTAANAHGQATTALSIAVQNTAVAPQALSYSIHPYVLAVGEPIRMILPRASGGQITRYSVEPMLPLGVQLDPQQGILYGQPVEVSELTTYTITGWNRGGTVRAELKLGVTAQLQPPTDLFYGDTFVFRQGITIAPLEPSNANGQIYAYTITPALPIGLSLDPETGIISGTPETYASQTLWGSSGAEYTVTGQNKAGTTKTAFHLQVEGR